MSGKLSQAAGPVPSTILQDEELNAAIAAYLPSNYSFEIHKTIHHARHYQASCLALQMPEGLTLWATAISDIIER
jgi:2-(3-amino-3-carboxypropyl)histidine synthase